MFNHLRELVIQQLQALDSKIRLVVVHPNYAEQHVVLGVFLDDQAIYTRFSGAKLNRTQLREQLEQAISTQNGSAALPKSSVVILDECDRALRDELDFFLEQIVREVGSGRIILFSREMPQCVLENEELRHQTAFIPDDEPIMLWDYARRDEAASLLEVRAFGEGRVLLNGQSVDNWDGVLPRSLFFYLVDRGMATRNEIFETFWPNLPVREATNVFHVTKRKISEVLGIDLTTYWSGFYRISPDIRLSYDVILFTEMVNNSAIAPLEESASLLTRATTLYQGPYLSATEADWTKRRRMELAQNYGEALAALAKTKEELGDKPHALGLYLQAAAINRQRGELVSNIMRLYHELNMHDDALAVYAQLSAELSSEPGIFPDAQLQEMAATIRRELEHSL